MASPYSAELQQKAAELFGDMSKMAAGLPKPAVNPLDHLDDKQKVAIKELRELIEKENWSETILCEHDKRINFLSDMTLYRFLLGYHWKVHDAAPVLKKAVEWRAKDKPWTYAVSDFEEIFAQSALFHYGFTKDGHPIVYVRLGLDKSNKSDEKVKQQLWKLFIWMQELCQARMPPNIYQIFWLIDIKDSSLSVSLVSALKDLFIQMGDYYVEVSAKFLVLNTWWTLQVVWTFLKPFLASNTVAKYQIKSSMKDKDLHELLTEHIDEQQLLNIYTGKAQLDFNVQKVKEFEALRLKEMTALDQ